MSIYTPWSVPRAGIGFYPVAASRKKVYYRSGASKASGAAILEIYPVRLARGSSPFAVLIKEVPFVLERMG